MRLTFLDALLCRIFGHRRTLVRDDPAYFYCRRCYRFLGFVRR